MQRTLPAITHVSPQDASLQDPSLAEHARAIKAAGTRVIGDVVEIGRHLTEAKKLCGHGEWLPWLECEFGWTDRTALNFMRVFDLSNSKRVSDLDRLPLSSLYLLAAPSTPEKVRTEVFERAKAGEAISVASVKGAIDRAKADEPEAEPEPAAEDLVEDPELIRENILDIISRHSAVVKGYKKILKASSLDQEAKGEVSRAIGGLISKWQSLQKTLVAHAASNGAEVPVIDISPIVAAEPPPPAATDLSDATKKPIAIIPDDLSIPDFLRRGARDA